MEHVASKDMVKNAVGEEYDELAIPPHTELINMDGDLKARAVAAICEVYDPEIPVNIYELGLIYKVSGKAIEEGADKGLVDLYVEMTLTSPACPVAQEMPMMVQSALFPLDGVRHVDVDIVWDPTWDPSMMAETAKLQLNMFT